MKKITLISITLMLLLSTFNISYGAVIKNLKAKFAETIVAGTDFKEITITPYDSSIEEDDDVDDSTEKKTYKIYLPSGYMVEGTSASYVADRNGKYPFTVYDGSSKKTFTYTVKNIDELEDDEEKLNMFFDYKLMYDYEKKQIFFKMNIDKLRTVITPDNTSITNEVNYYIDKLDNNVPYDFTITVDDNSLDYKVIKSGEFYILIYISPVNYNDYSTVVEYFGYNFTNNQNYTAYPEKDIYDDNGNYEVLIKSNNSQRIFNINITGIDYRRPLVDIDLLDDNTFNLEIEDDFELDYIITFDGQYKKATATTDDKFIYKHSTEISYDGEYIFIAVDKEKNRTVETVVITSRKRKARPHAINLEVHDFKDTKDLFENIGLKYEKDDDESRVFENILPAYMNGTSPNSFNPDSPISRAEMVTIFCRLNDLPYDTSAYLKSKFIDINDHWARDYISMGSSKKYVSGYKDKTFKPDSNITRAEFSQMLTKISAYKTLLNAIPASTNVDYPDINGHWAETDIIKIAGRNLVTTNADYFYPDKAITRGEVVHAINMLYGFNPTYIELAFTNSFYDKYFNFQDINKHKYYYDIIISVIGMYREKIQ